MIRQNLIRLLALFVSLQILIGCEVDEEFEEDFDGTIFGITNGVNASDLFTDTKEKLSVQLKIKHYHNGKLVINTHCSGTLIDSQWVLTAAHCLDDFTQNPAGAGSNELDPGSLPSLLIEFEGHQLIDAKWFRQHDNYILGGGGPDIALVQLASPVIIPVTPLLGSTSLVGEDIRCYGYGNNYNYPPEIGELHYGDFEIDAVDQTTWLVDYVTGSGWEKQMEPGDSGGGCFLNDSTNPNAPIYLSVVHKGGNPKDRGTAVAPYAGWIKTVIEQREKPIALFKTKNLFVKKLIHFDTN